MEVHDKNETLQPPAEFQFLSVRAAGAYLQLEYGKKIEGGLRRVVIYLNDMGREVLRTTDVVWPPKPPVATPIKSVGAWFKFRNGFLIALQGLREMSICLKK